MPEKQLASNENIRNYQEEEFRKLLVYLNKNSPFYKDHFNKHKVDLREIKGIADITRLPVTTKDDIQSRNWDFLSTGRNKIIEYCTTSGTMGLPVTIALTAKDMDRLAYNEYLSFKCAGGSSNDIYQLMLALDRQFMAGIAYYSGARKLEAGVIRVGPGSYPMQMDIINRLTPNVLVAVPSFIIGLINYAKEKSIDLNGSSVKRIICIGENIRNEDFSLNSLGEQIIKNWKVGLFSTYASSEKQTAFTECEFGRGGHHHEELLLFEVLDNDNNPLPPGSYGELTITTLGVEGMPLLRYKTGDICAYYNEPCACGRKSARISPVIGRKQQLIKYNGTTLYPQSIFNILNSMEEIRDYVVEVSKNAIETDDMLVQIALNDPESHPDQRIRHKLQSALRVLPKIKYISIAEVQKLQMSEGKRKISRFIDSR